MTSYFDGKVALVAGATAGMGRATAQAFAEAGAAVVLATNLRGVWNCTKYELRLLCSPGASFVIGHALAVDGGFTAH